MLTFSWQRPVVLCVLAAAGCDSAPAVQSTPIPPPVLRGLNTDAAVLDCFAGPAGESVAIPDGALAHRLKSVDASGEQKLIVEARHECLAGTSGLHWIYLRRNDAWRLVGRGQPSLAKRYAGQWLPKSAVYYSLEPLLIARDKLVAGQCEPLSYNLQPALDGTQLLVLDQPSCTLHGEPLSVLKLSPGKNDCEMELSVFANVAKAQNGSLVSRGVFSRSVCP